jgi:ribulose-phosphate 3-epimerase
MIIEPDHLLPAFAQAGANIITVHWEACPHLNRTLQAIKALGCRAGVAINPHIPANFLSEVIHLIDQVNVMTVNPGAGGQAFLPETLPKIRQIRHMIAESGRQIDLEVDGGVNPATASTVIEAGANILIAGSSIFNNNVSVKEGMDTLRRSWEN